jgi:hypothetical protein
VIVKRDHCKGPEEHNLLVTCRQVYDEALEILLEEPKYVIIERANAAGALKMMESLSMNPFLRKLIASANRLVMSSPGEQYWHGIRPDRLCLHFDKLEEVEVYGFYPNLPQWLYQDRSISMGWSDWHWKFMWYTSAGRPTKNRRINLSDAARWIHTVTGKDSTQLKVTLRAWEFEEPPGSRKWNHLYVRTLLPLSDAHS